MLGQSVGRLGGARSTCRHHQVGSDNEHTSIEKMVKVFKAHRNAKDFAVSCILKS